MGQRVEPDRSVNVSSTAREGYEDARRFGSDILSVRQFRDIGVAAVLDRIPAGERFYVTIDIDGFDPSIAPDGNTEPWRLSLL